MYLSKKRHCLFLLAIVFFSHKFCDAQGITGVFNRSNTLKPSVVYELELEDPLGRSARTADALVRGTLTRRGDELLINDPLNSQFIVVDVKTLAETSVQLESPAIDLKIDPESDMLYVETRNPREADDGVSSQTCYGNLAKLRSQTPQWQSETRLPIWQQIRWLPQHQKFVIVSRGTNAPVVLLDENGVNIGEQKVKGYVLAVDEVEEGFNIFFLVQDHGATRLVLTQLDHKWKEIKTRKPEVFDRPQNPGGAVSDFPQSFRLRGLKSGEVTKYFLNVASQPGYLDMRGRLPIGNLPSRFYYANKLSAAESASQPEIIVGLSAPRRHFADGFILFDRQGNFYYDPDQWLTDAIFDDERKLIVTVGHSKSSVTVQCD